jgi:toxin ParE1/3/4
MPRLIVKDQAEHDLYRNAEYIAEHNVDVADRFLQAARRTFALLAELPELGSPRKSPLPEFAELRVHPVKGFNKYLICYLPLADGVKILRVIHAAQDVDRFFR